MRPGAPKGLGLAKAARSGMGDETVHSADQGSLVRAGVNVTGQGRAG